MIGYRFAEKLKNMPTPSYKINEIVNTIIDRKNAVCMMYENVAADTVIEIIIERCRLYGIENIVLCDAAQVEGSPRLYFQRRAGVDISSLGDRINVDKIMESQECPELIVIRNIDSIDEESQKLWILFIREWGKASQIYKNPFAFRRSLLLDMKSAKLLGKIVHEPGWDVHWMYRWILPLECMTVLSELLLESEIQDGTGMWLEAILPEISGPDLELMSWLFNRRGKLSRFDGIFACLLEYAQNSFAADWDSLSKLYLHVKSVKVSTGNNVPEKLWPLWEAGLIDYVRDEGVFYNSAFLAVVDEREILRHRIWKGIVRVLLPSIDLTRVMVCNWLNDKYGNVWEDFCKQEALKDEKMYGVGYRNANNETDIHLTELRGIVNFMAAKEFDKHIDYARSFEAIKHLRDSRNAIAHGKLLDEKAFIKAIEECNKLKELVEL